MERGICVLFLIVSLCLSPFVVPPDAAFAAEDDLTPEQLVAAHVKSLGRPAVLAKTKSRTFIGTSKVEFIQGMNGTMTGTSMIVSDGPHVAVVMKFPDVNYPGEYFAYDGREVTVGHMSPGQKSPIADFLYRFSGLMKEGLIGGTLTSAWPLLEADSKGAELKCRKAKVEGKELYELEYRPKNVPGDMKIRMYFDMKTFRHVRTEYRLRSRDDMSFGKPATFDGTEEYQANVAGAGAGVTGMTIGESRPDSIYLLVEKFDEFRRIGGLTLPYKYELDYSLEGSGHAFIGKWTLNANSWGFNAKGLDPKIFKAEK
jgi:hypothetical protein